MKSSTQQPKIYTVDIVVLNPSPVDEGLTMHVQIPAISKREAIRRAQYLVDQPIDLSPNLAVTIRKAITGCALMERP